MKRDWDVIREVLIEIEEFEGKNDLIYSLNGDSPIKGSHALLLWKAGFITAINMSDLDGPAILDPELTWEGHDLLDTIRSKDVWERVKTTAKEKGIELTFEAVKMLGKIAVDWVITNKG